MQPIPPSPAPGGANPAQLGGILILVCALLILIGTFSRSWLSMSRGDFSSHIGLIGFEFCDEDRCRGEFFEPDMAKGVDGDITAARYLAFLGGLATAVLGGIGGALALGRKARSVPLLAIYIVAGITAFFAMLYVGRALSEMKGGDPGPGWSFFVAFLGLAGTAIIAGTMIRNAARLEPRTGFAGYPMQPGLQPGYYPPQPMAMGPQGAPPCPRCAAAGQVTYAAQYQRYFCGRCQQYV